MPEKEKKDKKAKKEEEDNDFDFGEKKKKKEKKKDDSDDEVEESEKKDKKDKKEKKEKKEKRKPTPLVCSIVSIEPVPKKDNLKVCKVKAREDLDELDIVTNAANVCVGGKFLVALPGVTTADGIVIEERKVGGVDSTGMFCSIKEMGWDDDILEPGEAVMLDDSAEIGRPATYEEAVQAFQERKKREAAEAEAKAAAEPKKPKADAKKKDKKKKGAKQDDDDDDFEAALAEAKAEIPAKEEPAPAEEEKKEEEEKVDAKTLANRKKKDKKKAGAKGAPDDDDDFEAALQEAKENVPEAPEPEAKTEETEDKEGKELEAKADEEVDAKTLANRKKKDKKKQKQAVAGSGFYKDDEEGDDKEGETPAPAASSKKGAEPKKETKQTAAARAIKERLDAQRAIEEERRKFEEEEKARIAEEERLEREEEEKLEAERAAKREARQAKIAKQKAEGTFQTKAQKLRAQRAAQLREQFGFDLDAVEAGEEEGSAPKPKKATPASKKKKRTQNEEATEEAPNEEDAKKEEEPKVEEKKPQVEEKKEETEDDDNASDDWEKLADTMAEVKDSDKDDEEEGSGSDDDSSSSSSSSSSNDSFLGYRSPIVCIMGHVDTGKTKLLDKIRNTNVQEGEAGGITQQIGATFFPDIALEKQTMKVDDDFEIEVPGLLIIDTPGHESFNNLRKRGSSLCDLAILVIDIMHGLEPQTVESLEMLKLRKCPFIIALNKIDRCFNWKSEKYTSIKEAMERNKDDPGTMQDFNGKLQNVLVQLSERGLNCALYWENEHMSSTISIVPTSAMTGEGVPDLLYMLLNISQNLMASNLEVEDELACTVIEVKNIEGLGTTVDVVLVNGTLREGDQIVIAGRTGPIVTQIRALLTPQPMKEMRVKSEYMHHEKISVSMGIKISAPGLDEAVAGTELKVVGPDDDIEELKSEVQDGFESILESIDKSASGVYVKASTLGSLEALLAFLDEMKIPVFDVGIGEVHKKDVKRAMIMKEKKCPEYAVILAFDVKVNADATAQAATDGVKIFTADIIYHLKEKFESYVKEIQESKKTAVVLEAVFPCILEIEKNYIFHKKDPIVVGCKVLGGQLRTGTPICVPDKDFLEIGRVGGIEKDKKEVKIARKGEAVCVKIEQNTSQNQIAVGRHFDHTNRLYSKISRNSIDTIKEHFKDEMKKEDWEVIIAMKSLFKIQ